MAHRWTRLMPTLMLTLLLVSPELFAKGRKPEDDDTAFDAQKEMTTPARYEISDPADKAATEFPTRPEDVGQDQDKQYDPQMGLSSKEKQAAHDISVPQK